MFRIVESSSTAPVRRPGHGHAVARERRGAYDTRPAALTQAVDRLMGRPVDELSDADVSAELAVVDRQVRRLQARTAELAGALTSRQAARARAASPNDARAGQRAVHDVRDRLRQELQWTPSQARQAQRTARQLESAPATRNAYRDGRLSPEHVRVLVSALDALTGTDRPRAEARLIAAGRRQDAVTFGRTCRDVLREHAPEASQAQADQRHGRRHARISQTADGMVRGTFAVAGVDGEILLTAINAFRRRDGQNEHRTPEQVTADALVAGLAAGMAHGSDGTERGSLPHVQVEISWQDLLDSQRPGAVPWTGSLEPDEVRRLLDNSTISRLLTGPDSLPLDTGRATRSVGAGVWRAIVARDGTCTWVGCDAPPSWCQAAHIERRWSAGAGVSADEVGLACTRHHRRIDRLGLIGRLEHGRIVWHPPD